VIRDNFSTHRTEHVAITAEILDIELVFLPAYSPPLNPTELIWKSIKKIVSRTFMKDQKMMIDTVKTNFIEFSKSKSLCENWVEVFVN
jgi:putative transposase